MAGYCDFGGEYKFDPHYELRKGHEKEDMDILDEGMKLLNIYLPLASVSTKVKVSREIISPETEPSGHIKLVPLEERISYMDFGDIFNQGKVIVRAIDPNQSINIRIDSYKYLIKFKPE